MLALRRGRGERAFETRGTPLMVCGCESVARFPGWSAIITRSGQNGNLPLHPINRQQAYYTGIQCILQAFSAPCANFFSPFFVRSNLKLRFSYASRRFSMTPLSGVSIASPHFEIPAQKTLRRTAKNLSGRKKYQLCENAFSRSKSSGVSLSRIVPLSATFSSVRMQELLSTAPRSPPGPS